MFELEDSLKAKETEELQRAVRNNELIPEAAAIASKILTSRKAEIPTPMTDAEMESVDKAIVRASNMKFLAAAAFLLGWLLYAYYTNLFAEGNGARLSGSVFVAGLAIWISLRTSKKR